MSARSGGSQSTRFAVLAAALLTSALALVPALTDAQTTKPSAAGRGARAPARRGSRSSAARADGGVVAESSRSVAGAPTGDGGSEFVAEKKSDGGTKVFRFGELEIEGRLKNPQLVFFLRRVRAEFAAGDLGHRSFMRELGDTKHDPNF